MLIVFDKGLLLILLQFSQIPLSLIQGSPACIILTVISFLRTSFAVVLPPELFQKADVSKRMSCSGNEGKERQDYKAYHWPGLGQQSLIILSQASASTASVASRLNAKNSRFAKQA